MTSFANRSSRPVANVDLAWLRMDEPSNRMTVTALLSLDQPIELRRLEATLERRLLCFRRFRQRIVPGGFWRRRPRWEIDPDFDLSHHVRCVALLPSVGEEHLRRLVGELMSTALDPERPLWQIHLIENYRGSTAVLVRIHHAIADGMALMRVLLSLTDAVPDSLPTAQVAPAGSEVEALVSILGKGGSSWRTAWRLGRRLAADAGQILRHPSRLGQWVDAAAATGITAGRLLLRPPDPPTVLRGELGVAKRVAWSQTLALDDVKAIGRATGCTVNDVLLAAMSGALRRYLESRGDRVDGLDLHAAVPVNLRPPTSVRRLGNRFGLVFPSLPVGIADPLDRLFTVRRRMQELKESPEAVVTFGILGTLGTSSERLQKSFVQFVGRKTSLVMTNVPGPRRRVYLAGAQVRSIMFWVPRSGRVGLGISILSYAGEVRLGIASDAGLLGDPERVAEYFNVEFEALRELARRPRAA